MRANRVKPRLVIVLSGLLLMSCLLPRMIPLNPEAEQPLPVMETDMDAMIETLQRGERVYLEELDEDAIHPLTITRTDGLLCLSLGTLLSDPAAW